MRTYIERFTTMIEEIRAHPLLEIVDFKINPPATKEVFDVVERKIGTPLAEPIRKFYEEANGMKLRWMIKYPSSKEKAHGMRQEYNDYRLKFLDNEEAPFAHIDLIPLEESLITQRWPQLELDTAVETEFAGEIYSANDFRRMLKPFDLCSIYYCMAFVLEKGIGNPKVILLQNYYIEWESSRITDFESYIEMLLATRGIVDSRHKIYNEYMGDVEPPLITGPDYWTEEHIPKLFLKSER